MLLATQSSVSLLFLQAHRVLKASRGSAMHFNRNEEFSEAGQ